MSDIDFYFDFKCPASYLAFGPTLALSQASGVRVHWRPYLSRQRPVPERVANEDKTQRHFRVRAEYRRRTHLHYAALRGIPMAFPEPLGDSEAALLALASQEFIDPQLIETGFHAYWVTHLDLDDPDTVARLFDIDNDAQSRGAEQLAQIRATADAAKVVEAPSYVLGEQLFMGREHLPWIQAELGLA
ncbi:MAG: DsbA family protein [Pseudomonadota bacterium]